MDRESDVEFVKRLMREESKALGFIPLGAVRTARRESRLLVASEEGRKTGYLLFGRKRQDEWVTVWQICVEKERRRSGVGKDLLSRLYRLAKERGIRGIRLRCAQDLRANRFWMALGFQLVSIKSSRKTGRRINVYHLTVT